MEDTQATVEIIDSITDHPNADALELAHILGYQCIVPINTYTAGEKIVFIQPDSVLPTDEPWAEPFLKYAKPRTKAVRLRGEWSEGIVLKHEEDLAVGTDVTKQLKITHYVRPVPDIAGCVGGLPHAIPKTDETRWENISKKLPIGKMADVTLKVDGQSWSAYYILKNKEFGVLGRRLQFDPETVNSYTVHVNKYNIREKLTKYCEDNQVSLCIRGESYGGGIQSFKSNPHAKLPKGLAIFSVYLIDDHRYAGKGDKFYFRNVCKDLDLPCVEIVEENVEVTMDLITKYSTGLKKLNGAAFEGVVLKGDTFHFKIINKHYDSLK